MRENKPKASRLLRPLQIAAILLAVASPAAIGETKLAADSPFAPAAGGPGGASASPAAAYELAGASSVGSSAMVCIFDTQARRSEWIAVGDTSGPIHVVSLDSQNDRAVVMIAGERKELSLRKATFSAPALAQTRGASVVTPRQPPAPAAPLASANTGTPQAAPPDATKAARDQQEARMLISDLLEIGAQQRKAYQDAKLKATQTPAQPSN